LSRIEDSRKGGTDYRYDPVGRLIEAVSPVAKERFAFDPASNIIDPVRIAETPASRPSPVRPESTLPVEVPKVLGNLLKAYAGMHFEYDARGNLVRKRTPAGEQEYEWDEFNRLLSARVAETARQSQARYFYDAFGRRIAKEVNGERTVFGWDGDTLAYESDGERGTHYLYEPGTFVPLAQYVAGPVEGIETPGWKSTDRYVPEEDPLQKVPERRGDAAVFYYHCDQIGTPQLLTDDDGDVVWEASYKAWGEAREVIARASKAAGIVARSLLRFQGQHFDDETGLHYNRHRYYDPSSGRFVSNDPIGLAGGINVFQYAPNPITWIDPLGLTGTFPSNPDDMTKVLGVDPKIGATPDGTPRYTWFPNSNTRIRYESHPEGLCPCSRGFNPRHHGAHYHVETKPDGLSWGQAARRGAISKSKPDGYTPGSGTGFTPGENFPGG
jgi:RHS repeat-associated protein